MQKGTCTLLVFHGSRLAEGNLAAEAMVRRLEADLPGQRVRAAFLQWGTPDLPTGLATARTEGFSSVSLFPLFFLPGRHAGSDIPAAVEAFRAAHPEVSITVRPPLTEDPAFQDWLAGQIAGNTDTEPGPAHG